MESKIDKNKDKEDNERDILYIEIRNFKSEFCNKIEEYEKLKENITELRKTFQQLLNEYTSKKNNSIKKEKEIEFLLLKNAKMKKKLLISINQTINKKFYLHLQEVIKNSQIEKSLFRFFYFIFNIYDLSKNYHLGNEVKDIYANYKNYENTNINNILRILKNENEIRNLLLYVFEIMKNLEKEEKDIYDKIKNIFFNLYNKLNTEEKQYPIDFLYDIIKNIINIIENETLIKNLKKELNILAQEKNLKFIEIKNIETSIIQESKNRKLIKNYIKTLNSFFIKLKEQEGNITQGTKKQLIDDIEKFKYFVINYDKNNNDFDGLSTSKSFSNNLIFSDKSSIKNSFLEYKNNIENIDFIFKKNNNNNSFKKTKKEDKNYIKINKGKNINGIFNRRETQKGNKSLNIKRMNDINNIKNKNLYKTMKINKSLNRQNNMDNNKIKKTKIAIKQNENRRKKQLIPQLKSLDFFKTLNGKNNYLRINENNNIIPTKKPKRLYMNKNNKNNTHNINEYSKINKTQNTPKKSNFTKILIHQKNIDTSEKSTINENENKHYKLNEKLINATTQKNNGNNFQNNKGEIKQKEPGELIEFTLHNKDKTYDDDSIDINEVKDSICDEMISNNFNTKENIIRFTTNDYINKLGFHRNILWSDNLYKNKIISNYKNLNIEKPIDTSACCAACT